jgi:hypothetical protein
MESQSVLQQYESAVHTFFTHPPVSHPDLSAVPVVPSQTACAHVPWGGDEQHLPPTHVCPDVHAVPHALQFLVSVIVFVHALVHHVRALAQQWPLEHACALVHAAPHAPQFASSLVVSTQFDAQHEPVPHDVLQLPQWSTFFVTS